MAKTKSNADPITVEILRNTFHAIAQDMNAALIRSAYTPLICDAHDCAVALLDENANVLGMSMGLPLFLGNLDHCVQLTAELFGWDYFKDGDIFFLNDSYMAGTHLNDITVFAPIFWNGQRIGFSASRAHHLDVGSKDACLPVDSHEIYQEGMRWAPTRIYREGVLQTEIEDVLKRNSRFGDSLIGDLNAQIAAGKTGEKRLRQIVDRFGLETVKAARDDIFKISELLERKAVSAVQDGRYVAEGCLDNDRLDDSSIPVKVTIDIEGDSIAVDLTGTSAQRRGPVNCGFTQTVSAVRVAFHMLINTEREIDGGAFRTLSVTAPKKSILYAQEPAACTWYFSSLGLLIDLIQKALAPIMPDNVAAAHYGDSMLTFIGGNDPRHNDERFLMIEPTTGGWGAYSTGDGQDCMINSVNGSVKDIPIEVFEARYPIRISAYQIVKDTGGPGRYRGGNGTRRQYDLLADSYLTTWFERSKTTAWGLFGGSNGKGPRIVVSRADGTEPIEHLKFNVIDLKKGDRITARSGGGGGFGSPLDRPPEEVCNDIQEHYISKEHAEKEYGVIVDEDLNIDTINTDRLRQQMRNSA